jgi:hypothetical protein
MKSKQKQAPNQTGSQEPDLKELVAEALLIEQIKKRRPDLVKKPEPKKS